MLFVRFKKFEFLWPLTIIYVLLVDPWLQGPLALGCDRDKHEDDEFIDYLISLLQSTGN